MEMIKQIDTETLRRWMETKKAVSVLDIRPSHERTEWYIPGSIHINAYDKLKADHPDALEGLHLDKSIPVVAVCGGGKTSMIAAGLLQRHGFEAYSLQGGMKSWSLSWNTARISFRDFDLIQLRRTGKGCLSYIIASDKEAIVVDASLPVEAYEEILENEKWVLKFVVETHIHADHLSRSKQLAERNNAALYLPVPNKVDFQFEPVNVATVFAIGSINMKAIPTPGHTPESTSYLVSGKLLLTGDTLFANGVGRPDLKATTAEAVERSALLFDSLHQLLSLDDKIIVLPAHASQPVDFDHIPIQSTISDIQQSLPMLHLTKEDFIKNILQRIPPTPANYLTIVEKNISGDFSDINPVDLEAGANRCAIS